MNRPPARLNKEKNDRLGKALLTSLYVCSSETSLFPWPCPFPVYRTYPTSIATTIEVNRAILLTKPIQAKVLLEGGDHHHAVPHADVKYTCRSDLSVTRVPAF